MSKHLNFFITCAKNITDLLEKELVSLGATKIKQNTLGVSFSGELSLGYRVCLWSRLANRVLLQLAICNAEDISALYEGAKKIKWHDHFGVESSFTVDFLGISEAINNSHFGALKVKDAIVDQFRAYHGKRPNVDKENPDIRINVYLHEGRAAISLDLAGDSLHRRGYRKIPGQAPIKETLAAAILYRCNWPQLFNEKPLLDPMCGSGTILIEAAMIAQDCAPGLLREKFGFSRWLNHDEVTWKNLKEEARERRLRGARDFTGMICGSDYDANCVNAANSCLEQGKLTSMVKNILVQDVRTTTPQKYGLENTGIIITNPPYGKRLQEIDNLGLLYQRLGEQLRNNFVGWETMIFTGNSESCRKLMLRPRKQYNFFNGTIPCKLLLFDIRRESFWRECL